jgi:hypothetical protein
MIRLLPIATEQIIYIIPRDYSAIVAEVFSMTIYEDGTKVNETVVPTVAILENYVQVNFTSTIFKEDSVYSFTVIKDSNLFYRGKITISSQTDQSDIYTLNTGEFQENESSNTEYTVIES